MKCSLNSLLLVPWGKVVGTSDSLSAVWEIWSRHFASAVRNDLNFVGQLLNRLTFCDFNLLSRLNDKCFWEYYLQRKIGSKRLWRLIKHRCVKRIDQSDNIYYHENLQKGGLVHRVPYTKSREKLQELFQSVCVLFCKYKQCNLF